MKRYFLLVLCLLLLMACGLFKRRVVDKSLVQRDSAAVKEMDVRVKTDAVSVKEVRNDVSVVAENSGDWEWVIETDTGNVSVSAEHGFTGKAKSVKGKGNYSGKSDLKDKSTATEKAAAKKDSAEKGKEAVKTGSKSDVKRVDAKPDYGWVGWLAGLVTVVAAVAFISWRYASKMQRMPPL